MALLDSALCIIHFCGMECRFINQMETFSGSANCIFPQTRFQGFKMATTFLEFKMEAVANPKQHGDVALLIKAIGNSWLFILMYQGIVLQSLQKILSGKAKKTISSYSLITVDPVQQETFLGGFQFSALPSLLRLPIEILTLSTLVATINLLSGILSFKTMAIHFL